jgi:hypothetical protein
MLPHQENCFIPVRLYRLNGNENSLLSRLFLVRRIKFAPKLMPYWRSFRLPNPLTTTIYMIYMDILVLAQGLHCYRTRWLPVFLPPGWMAITLSKGARSGRILNICVPGRALFFCPYKCCQQEIDHWFHQSS